MVLSWLRLLAEGEAAPQAGGNPMMQMVLMFAPLLILAYFIMIRPARKQEQLRQQMITNMKKNDKVLTSSGIYGNVISVSDKEDEVVIRVDDNARLRVIKSSIARNITQEEALKQPKEIKPSGA